MIVTAKDCIKNARYQLGLTQDEFAKLVGISRMEISYLELGKRKPGFKNTRKIVDMLKKHNINIEYTDLRSNK